MYFPWLRRTGWAKLTALLAFSFFVGRQSVETKSKHAVEKDIPRAVQLHQLHKRHLNNNNNNNNNNHHNNIDNNNTKNINKFDVQENQLGHLQQATPQLSQPPVAVAVEQEEEQEQEQDVAQLLQLDLSTAPTTPHLSENAVVSDKVALVIAQIKEHRIMISKHQKIHRTTPQPRTETHDPHANKSDRSNRHNKSRPLNTPLKKLTIEHKEVGSATNPAPAIQNTFNFTTYAPCKSTTGRIPVEILQVDSRPLEPSLSKADYNTIGSVINYLYAKKYRYPYVYVRMDLRRRYRNSPNVKDERTCNHPTLGDRASPWCKLLAIHHRLQNTSAERVMYLDTDAIFFDAETSLTQSIKETEVMFGSAKTRAASMIVATDWPWHMGGLVAPATSGIMLFAVSEMSNWILKQWWSNPDYPSENFRHPYEQNTLTRSLFKQDNSVLLRRHISVLDWKAFNEHEGQFFRHIGKADDSERLPFLRSHLKKLNIDNAKFERLVHEIEQNCVVVPDIATLEREIVQNMQQQLPRSGVRAQIEVDC